MSPKRFQVSCIITSSSFFPFGCLKLQPLAHRKLDFEEFCAAAVSVYQLEALEEWEQIATIAFDDFEREGSRAISVQELAEVC